MAGTIAKSSGLTSAVVRLENGELAGSSSRKARRVRVTSAGVAGVNLRARSGSSCLALGRRLQMLTGMGPANAVDALAMRSGRDFRSAGATAVSSVSGKASRGVVVAMFERFTEKAIKVIILAQEVARRLGHNFVGTEQILLGLIGEGKGIAAKSGAELRSIESGAGFRRARVPRRLIGVRAAGVDPGRIGSRRKKGGGLPAKSTEPEVEDKRKEPFLRAYTRRYREEGHQALDDGETLLAKASNPYGFVLQIAEEANEYLRNNKEESLRRKPILKVISDRINEAYGEGLRDSYLNETEDYSEFEQ